jgi:hypothetical protein
MLRKTKPLARIFLVLFSSCCPQNVPISHFYAIAVKTKTRNRLREYGLFGAPPKDRTRDLPIKSLRKYDL